MDDRTSSEQAVGGSDDNNIGIDLSNVPVCSNNWGGHGCRVIGCSEDIYSQRAVNLKYRLCKTHKSAEVLLVHGLPKRFCSQCSTFKIISDFNGKMRACRTCLRHRSASRSIKRDFLNTFTNADTSGQQQQNGFGGQINSTSVMENAHIETFMAGAALAEILRDNGNTEPVAIAAAMATAAAARGAINSSHQQQQQPPLRIIAATPATITTGMNRIINQNALKPSVPQLTTETMQQETALVALLTAAATSAPTLDPTKNYNISRYHALFGGAKDPAPSAQPQQPQQQQQQQQPFSTAPALHSLVEMHRLQQTPTSLSSTQNPEMFAKGLELKRQRVLAELHLARTSLELAQVEEEISKIRYRQQQQQRLAAGVGTLGGKGPKANGTKRSTAANAAAAVAAAVTEKERPGTPKN